MPSVQFKDRGGELRDANMFAPKSPNLVEAWYRAARKVIPEIPDPAETDWFITSTVATIQRIRFDLSNSVGESCHIIINRRGQL